MANTLGAKPVIDTSEFKSGLATMNADLRVLESGFRANTASMGDWAQSGTGLETRIKSLNSQMDVQRGKVALLKTEYERIKATKGEDATATKNAEVAYNKSVETLGKMENELGQTETALSELTDETEESGDVAVETGDKWAGLKSVMGGVTAVAKATVTVVLGLVAAVAAVAVAIGGLVFTAADAAGALTDMSAKTGISTTRLQEMEFIGSQVGVSLDTIAGAQGRLTRSMGSAQEQFGLFNAKMAEAQEFSWDNLEEGDVVLGDMAAAFDKLGVSVTNADGSLRNQQDVMADTFAALDRIENPAERDALAMEIFGKSALELNPLLKLSAEEMASMTDEAHKLGAVVSEEDIAALDEFGDTLDGMKLGLQGTLATLATAFLPGFQAVFDTLGGYLEEFSTIVSAFSSGEGGIEQLSSSLTGLVAQIATDIAAAAPQMLEAGLGIVMGILNAIMAALPSLLKAGVSILTSLVKFIITALPTLIPMGIEVLMMLINTIISNLPMLVDAALQAIITLANGLSTSLPVMIPAIIEAVIMIVNVLLQNMPLLIDAALKLIIGLANGLVKALPVLIKSIPIIIRGLFDAIIVALPMIAKAAGELIATLAAGIIAALPGLIGAAVEIINIIIDTIQGLPELLWDIGKGIVEGIWQGIQNAKDWFIDMITDFFQGLIDSILGALGIQPSEAFGEIGRQSMRNFAEGFEQEFKAVEKQLARAMGGLQMELNPAFAGAGAGGLGATTNQSSIGPFYAPVIIQGTQTAGSLGAAIKGKRF